MGFWDKVFGSAGEQGPRGSRGYSTHDPIACNGPEGEQDFLRELRCPRGHGFQFRRVGSMLGRCPDPTGHSADGGDCVVDKFSLECAGGEHVCELFLDMYHPGAQAPAPPRGLTSVRKTPLPAKPAPRPTSITLHYEADHPAWRISVVQPTRFSAVRYELTCRLFRMPQGALFGVLLNLYDVPDQPYFLHRVMDLSDPEVVRYLESCAGTGSVLAVFEPKGEDHGFQRRLTFDPKVWRRCLTDGQRHNKGVRVNGDQALSLFLEVFNPVSREKGVEPAWDEVERRYDCSAG